MVILQKNNKLFKLKHIYYSMQKDVIFPTEDDVKVVAISKQSMNHKLSDKEAQAEAFDELSEVPIK